MTLRHKIAVLFILCCATLSASAQTTSVTLQATDADGQSWNNGTWTAVLYSPPGVPNTNYVIAGIATPVPNQTQTGALNGTGGGLLTVTPNTSIVPSGTQWQFTFCSQASPSPCQSVAISVSGSSQTVAPVLAGIRVSVQNPTIRVLAYQNLEVTGAALGSMFFNLTGSSLYLCTIFSGGVCTWTVVSSSGLPTAAAQLGDIIRSNVNNDSQWDAVNSATPISYLYPQLGNQPSGLGGGMFGTGCCGQPSNCNGINPTTSTPVGCQFSTGSTAQTITNIGSTSGVNGNNSLYGILEFYRWTMKFSIQNTTNARYWMGLASWCSGGCSGTGINGTSVTGTTRYAQDSPNATTLGFRFSSTTDNHWQALSCIAGASVPSCTFVDTGITPDTNIHQFDMTVNYAKTQVNFYVDLVLVASITTNVNFNQTNGNGWGSWFWTGDNKNTATNVQFTFYSAEFSHRL